MAQTVIIGEQKVCPESESLKFSATPTPQVENPSDSDSTTPTLQPCLVHLATLKILRHTSTTNASNTLHDFFELFAIVLMSTIAVR